ncbi:cadherin-like domain-containing protein, partial [Neptunomonas phycophila]|uniref:Ig-like domain-containing protein n=1 Tax=Neptunomonas phycophila TaxID=1572645 RepID=UPI0026E18B6B
YLAEGSETLDMVLSNPSNATIADGVGVGMILDDTTATAEDTVYANIAVDQSSVSEGAQLTYTVTLVDSEGNPVIVPAGDTVSVDLDWSGAAASGADTSDLPASVSITGGSQTEFAVDASFDDIVEADEPLIATITDVVDSAGVFERAEVGPQSVANTVITDGSVDATDDTASTNEDTPVTISVLGNDVDPEGQTFTIESTTNPDNGSIVVNPDGTITYTPDANYNGSDTFTYTIVDQDGNRDTATVVVSVLAINDAPIIDFTEGNVSEEGLIDGSPDSDAASGSVDTTDSASVNGTVNIVDIEGDNISGVTLTAPTSTLTSGGETVTWSGSGTQNLTATANGETVATISIDDSGNYQFNLLKALDHPDTSGEDSFGIDFGVSASDGSLTGNGTLRITVEDDGPEQVVAQTDELAMIDTNLMIILDTSGSMDFDSGIDGQTRLESAIDSIITLLQRYDEFGDVSVRLVTFSSNASAYGNSWEDIDTAIAQLEAIRAAGATGGTNYDEALGDAINAFDSNGKITEAQNISYFFSDGLPTFGAGNNSSLTGNRNGTGYNQNGNDTGISANEEATWTNFLNTNQVKSFAIGMGEGINDVSYLDPIAYDGQASVNLGGTIVSSFDELDDVLAGTVISPISGKLVEGALLSESLGADGGYVRSVTVEGVTYTLDIATSTISVSGGANNSSFDATENVITINTSAGGIFTVDMDDGDYNYTAPDSVSESIVERMDFVLSDMDGDTSSSYVEVDVERMNVLIGTTGSETLNGSNDGPDLIIGRDGNDIIFGNSGNDRLKGGNGNDEIHGGDGDDRITGGPGSDLLSGDAGDDIFIWGAPGSSDTITDFAVYQNPGDERDVLDLSDLLQGETTDTLDQYLHFAESGADTVVYIKSDGGINADGSNADQIITLQSTTDLGAGVQTDADIIQQLLSNNQLIVD